MTQKKNRTQAQMLRDLEKQLDMQKSGTHLLLNEIEKILKHLKLKSWREEIEEIKENLTVEEKEHLNEAIKSPEEE